MKQNGLVAIVFVVGCATSGVAAQLVVPPVRGGTAPMRWEYYCALADASAAEVTVALNRLGAAGFELVSMAQKASSSGYGSTAYTLCTRRALP
jgi:hypothetical protein